MHFLRAYFMLLIGFAVVDGLWITFVAKPLYEKDLSSIMKAQVAWLPIVIFYVIYPAILWYLALQPATNMMSAFTRGACVGCCAYGAYALTCHALFRDWTLSVTLMDAIWGTLLSGVVACGVYRVLQG